MTVRSFLAASVVIGCAGKTAAPSEDPQPSPDRAAEAVAMRPQIKCHRGASDEAPENTVAAVRRCFERGGRATEVDARLSSDGVPVVIHDEDTLRVAGLARLVKEQTAEELVRLDVGAWRGSQFAGEKLPTLAAVLDALPADGTIFVEIKDGPRSARAIAGVIRASGHARVAIESFDFDSLLAMRREAPELPLHLTIGSRQAADGSFVAIDPTVAQAARDLGIAGLSVDWRGVTAELAAACADRGLELAVWTINSAVELERLEGLAVDWIETDRPALIARALAN